MGVGIRSGRNVGQCRYHRDFDLISGAASPSRQVVESLEDQQGAVGTPFRMRSRASVRYSTCCAYLGDCSWRSALLSARHGHGGVDPDLSQNRARHAPGLTVSWSTPRTTAVSIAVELGEGCLLFTEGPQRAGQAEPDSALSNEACLTAPPIATPSYRSAGRLQADPTPGKCSELSQRRLRPDTSYR